MFRPNLKFANLHALIRTSQMSSNVTKARQYVSKPVARSKLTVTASTGASNTAVSNSKISVKPVSTAFAMQEFFMHPLTWDRNNGFFNILLGLAIFGYCFCASCQADAVNAAQKSAQAGDKKK